MLRLVVLSKLIGKDIFICVPVNVTVDYTDKEYTEISDKLAWKEPQA